MERVRRPSISDHGMMHSRSSGNGMVRAGEEDGLDIWQPNGFMPDYSAQSFDPITPSFLVDHSHAQTQQHLHPPTQQPQQQRMPQQNAAPAGAVKNDLAFMQQQQQQQQLPVVMHLGQSSGQALSYPTPVNSTSVLADEHAYNLQHPLLSSSSSSAPQTSISPALQQQQYSVSPLNGHSMAMQTDTSFAAASNSAAYSQSYGVVPPIGSLGYPNGQQQQQQNGFVDSSFVDRHAPTVKSEVPFSPHQPQQQNPHQPPAGQATEQLVPVQAHSRKRGSDQLSVSSVSSAASRSTPDAHLVAVSGSSHSDRSTSHHTSPLISSPQSPANPNSPAPLHTNSPTPVPCMPPIVHRNSGVRSVNENSSVGGLNHGFIGTLQSPTDILLSVHLSAGGGKKKSWPSRLISFQSLNNPSLSFAQLLFHAANISTFVSVTVEGKGVPDAAAAGTTVAQCAPVKTRLEQVAEAAAAQGLSTTVVPHHRNGSHSHLRPDATADREHSLSSNSLGSTPTHYSSALDLPPLEVVFHFSDNVKSCTRLGCLNLLVIKSNRRACNICQSQGAEIPASLLRRLVLHPHHPPSHYAYLEQILEDYEYWKFDSLDDHSIANVTGGSNGSAALAVGSSAAHNGTGFPFAKQAGYYIAFVDAGTARHVTRDFNHKIGSSGSSGSSSSSSSSSEFGTASMVEVDPNFSYAIKMKSHFWMLEVRMRSDGSPSAGPKEKNSKESKAKSKFYKKVGKPNQSRSATAAAAAAAAAAARQQQEQAANANDGYLVPFGQQQGASVHSTPNLSNRRFDGEDSQQPQQQQANGGNNNVLHINHININMPSLSLPKLMSSSTNSSHNQQPMLQHGGGGSNRATIEEISDEPTTNSVHVSDTSFRLMKNQPVNALLSVHDSGSSATAAAGATSSGNSAAEPVDSKPLLGDPTPVVLVYRDMDAYQRDVLLNAGGGNNGGGSNGNNNNNNGGGFNGNSGNDNDFNGGGGNSGPSNKRSRYNGPSSGGNGGGQSSGNHPMNTTNNGAMNFSVLNSSGLNNLQMGAALGLNPASMAGVAAAVNQFQFAQVAQAQLLQQQLFQQVAAGHAIDSGYFPGQWGPVDRSAAEVAAADNAEDDRDKSAGGTQGDIELMPVGRGRGRGRGRRAPQQHPPVDADGNAITFDDEEEQKEDGGGSSNSQDPDADEEDGSRSRSATGSDDGSLGRQHHRRQHDGAVEDADEEDEDEEITGDDGELIGERSVGSRTPSSVPEGRKRHVPAPIAPPSGRGVDQHGLWPAISPASNVGIKKRNPHDVGMDRDAGLAQMLLIEELDGRVHKGLKPAIQSLQPVEQPANLPYKAFNGMGPLAGFLRSFYYWQQSFYGTLITLLLGLLALVILSKNAHPPKPDDRAAQAMELVFYTHDLPQGMQYAPEGSSVREGMSRRAMIPESHGHAFYAEEHSEHDQVLKAMPDLHGALQDVQRAVRQSKATTAAAVSSSNSTDSSDPVTLTRRLAASLQLFASMRESSVIFHTWASSAPVAVANMLNPAPGSPAVVNFDVLSNNCRESVRIARAIGDYVLSSNGLLAAFSSLAAPAMYPAVSTSSQLCGVLSSDVGGIYLYDLVCNQWLAGNSLAIPMGASGLDCSMNTATWVQIWSQASCTEIINNVANINMTNAFFLPYNTTVSTGSNPTVYAANGPTSDVPATTSSGSVQSTAAPSPSAAALAALNALPHLGAMSFYSQASNLRSLCTSFNVIIGLITTLGPPSTTTSGSPSGTSGAAPTLLTPGSSALSNFTTAGGYAASAPMFGFLALGSLGLLLMLQLAIFVLVVLLRSCCLGVKAGVQEMAEVAMPSPIVPGEAKLPKQPKQPKSQAASGGAQRRA